jgi:hypothetical protein
LVEKQALEEFCDESLKLGLERAFERQKQILMTAYVRKDLAWKPFIKE